MENTQIPIQRMEIAARNVDKSLAIDNSAPNLLDLMNISPQVLQTASGLTDHDYPILNGIPLSLNNMTQMKLSSKVPLPVEIMEHFGHVQCHCMMGLFPELKRAWLTVDSDIYVWTFEENADLAYFDGLNETILCVGLVKPKSGVFQSFIKFLLILVTSLDIVVLGVTFTDPEAMDEIQLIPEPIFTLPTDGTFFSTIKGTNSGRIFLGSKDGSLYEIVYQAESGWFGKRCKKVNLSTSVLSYLVPSFLNAALSEDDSIVQIEIDNSRNILYVLTEKGAIEVCDLGVKGNSFSRVIKVGQTTLVNQAVHIVKTIDSQNFQPIVSISAIESTESKNFYLVAVTQTGVRFYLTTHMLFNCPCNQRPYNLTLTHVRLPPGYSVNITVRPRAVHMAKYSDRNLILISTVNEKDIIWCVSSDLFPFSQNLMECYTTINLEGPALAMTELIQENNLNNLQQDNCPLVVRQHYQAPKKYAILTLDGVYIFTKLRPVDILRQLLVDSHGQDSELIKAFFMIQKEDQACATSLIIASLDSEDNMELAELATRAFFMFGGEPKVSSPVRALDQTNICSMMFNPNVISTPGPHHYQAQPQNLNYTQTQFDNPFVFSSKHNGLYIYLSRILRPIWNRKCIEIFIIDSKNSIFNSTITSENCHWILNYLTALHNFLTLNTQLSLGDNTSQTAQSNLHNTTVNKLNNTVQDAQIEERVSLNSLKLFVCHCCQLLGFWCILCEHQFHFLISKLDESQQQILLNTTFKDLFLYGQDICSILISTLIDSYLGDNASVDSISIKLREVCPDLYKVEDAAFSKANEILKSSRIVQNFDEKQEMILNALKLCKTIVPNVNLTEICKQFVALKAYDAVIDLCITCAKKIDPENVAQHFYKNDSNVADQEGRNFYLRRMSIYKEVFNMLDTIHGENQSVPLNQSACQTDPQSLIFKMINEILEYPDEILHVALFEWMLSKQMLSELIKIKNPSLETYLIHSSQQNNENTLVMDLLWKYYENNNNHAAAAKVLENMATRSTSAICLKKRIEYLTRAIMCMRSDKVGYAPYLGVFLRDLEDKLDVARVQEQVLNALDNLQHPSIDEAKKALNSNLFLISQLYENFAEPFELWECKLAIIDTAGYNDENLIEQIWMKILKQELQKTTGTANNKMGQILSKIKMIARERGVNSTCFPLAFLVSELEQLATYIKADESMVPECFVTLGISFDTLIDIYNKLIISMSEIQVWQREENEFHLFKALATLIDLFIKRNEDHNSIERRKIISLCQDSVASVLSILYSKQNTEDIINNLRGIQSRLSRL